MLRYVLLLVFSACFAPLCAQATAIARVDSNRIFLGDVLSVQIQVSGSSGSIAAVEPDKTAAAAGWELLEAGTPTSSNGAQVLTLKITAWDLGERQIPAFRLQAGTQEILSNALTVDVQAPASVDSTYVADIKGIVEGSTSWRDYLGYILGTLGLLIGSISGYAGYRYWQRKKIERATPTPERWVLQQLDLLEAGALLARGDIAEYHQQAAYLLREYLQRRFGIHAPFQTSDETQAALQTQESPLLKTFQKDIAELLLTADLVKFARATPLDAAHRFATDATRRLAWEVVKSEQPKK